MTAGRRTNRVKGRPAVALRRRPRPGQLVAAEREARDAGKQKQDHR
jgi:hypothetical protein